MVDDGPTTLVIFFFVGYCNLFCCIYYTYIFIRSKWKREMWFSRMNWLIGWVTGTGIHYVCMHLCSFVLRLYYCLTRLFFFQCTYIQRYTTHRCLSLPLYHNNSIHSMEWFNSEIQKDFFFRSYNLHTAEKNLRLFTVVRFPFLKMYSQFLKLIYLLTFIYKKAWFGFFDDSFFPLLSVDFLQISTKKKSMPNRV